MKPEVNAISGRLSLRTPQREGLEILDRVMEIAPPGKDADLETALATIRSEFPHVEDFERDFPSLCFALATGVGKTRLMGAFISYLHIAHNIDNFFVLAPNLTIYNKLISDFSESSPKYVFRGISAFATNPPDIITGETWESYAGRLFDVLIKCRINIFNISKINTEVRGGNMPRIKRLSEYIGQSYFDWLAQLDDLVLLMDESHRYRASAGVKAINELNPILGLELTATPYVTSGSKTVPFRNVIQDYSLRRAMEDGFVKEPAVVTRRNLQPDALPAAELERMKLEDGIRLHEQTKVELETYARNNGQPLVKPFVLVIARDTTHAGELLNLIQSDDFFEGRYRDKVIQVDSSGSGAEKDETIERLLKVEQADEPTEVVIHVNMLKEGWDVTNLYTIVPLRTASARVLIEQTIGRGLRLPYGKRTGVAEVDRLSIVAHDRFQELVEEARRPDSPIQLKTIVLSDDEIAERPHTVVAVSNVESRLGTPGGPVSATTQVAGAAPEPLYTGREDQKVATTAWQVMNDLRRSPELVPNAEAFTTPEVQARVIQETQARYSTGQLGLDGVAEMPDVAAIVRNVTDVVVAGTISIPRITVVPVGDVRSGYRDFALDLTSFNFPPVDDSLWTQELRTGKATSIGVGLGSRRERRPEDYIVSGLIDFDDISYDDHAPLLQSLASEVVSHLQTYLEDEQLDRVLQVNQRTIARSIHSQMQQHYWEEASGGFESKVTAGTTEIKGAAFSHVGPMVGKQHVPATQAELRKTVFTGYDRCLLPAVKFDSDPERMLALVLDRDSEKWFRPSQGQFQISYRLGSEWHQYQPDFVAELDNTIVMLEPKRADQLSDPEVVAKRDAGVAWCKAAREYAASTGGKPWRYALIPHNAIAENVSISYLVTQFATE